MLIKLLDLILIHGELKLTFLTPSAALSLTSSIISCSNVAYISALTWHNYNTDIVKINFAIIYLTGVVQDLFEIGLNQEDQNIL